MLDDASFFAAQSTHMTNFVVTTSFVTYITRPIVLDGDLTELRATGRVTSASKSLILAEAVMTLPDGTEVARGSGTFMPHPKMVLQKMPAYADDDAFPLLEVDDFLEEAPRTDA